MAICFDCFYFGCCRGVGHYLFTPTLHRIHSERDPDLPDDFPVNIHVLDAGLLGYPKKQIEGEAVVSHIGGWTILSFWDRSVDGRPGSNSNFIMRGTRTFDEASETACGAFPEIWQRLRFPIQLRKYW